MYFEYECDLRLKYLIYCEDAAAACNLQIKWVLIHRRSRGVGVLKSVPVEAKSLGLA